MQPRFFATPAGFRRWLAANHATASELWVGFYKKGSGEPSITWPESVDEALCYGWIDGVRKTLDASSYTIRFTPRRPGSIWSAVNTNRAEQLIAQKRMRAAGRKAFDARSAEKTAVYSYERASASFDATHERAFKRNKDAWRFFAAQPPSYRRLAAHWVTSAKKEETRAKRLTQLIEDSARGRRRF